METTCVNHRRALWSLVLGTIVCLVPSVLRGATPTNGTVSEANPLIAWTGPLMPATGAGCDSPNNAACDNFQLTVLPPSSAFGAYVVEIRLDPALEGDWDIEVYDVDGALVDSSGGFPGQSEVVVLRSPTAGTYTVAAAPFAPAVGPDVDGDLTPDSYAATAELKPDTAAATAAEPVSYAVHQAPSPFGRTAGEPSCGVNWNSNRVMFISRTQTLRITLDDCTSPARDTWEDKSYLTTSIISGDPILFTDNATGRTFVSQLLAVGLGTPAGVIPILTKQSLMAFTDDDGENWLPSQGSGINSGFDHQTVGGGRFVDPLARDPEGEIYPHAVYYCSQDIADAYCARSDDGGLTFGPAVPIYAATECDGLHGAVKVAPNDGTVYVPNKSCNGQQAVVVSEDNGLTWDVREITGSTDGPWDPSVGIATDGTVYVLYGDGDGRPKVAVSEDKGRSWINIRDVGANVVVGSQVGVKHVAFPVAVAGDPDRAAVAWLGSTEPTPGGSGDDPDWPGDWYLYAAHTYDRGLTWTTVNVTPNDPVQRGTICGGGTGCSNGTRNLLDFMDSDVDAFGRVVVAYADGCIGPCVDARPNSFTEVATVARQVNGPRLFAAFDALDVPGSPQVRAVFDACPAPGLVVLSWPAPDDHGSPITSYNIYRRRVGDADFTLLATVNDDVRTYTDTDFDQTQQNLYRVTAINAAGESTSEACAVVSPQCPGGGGSQDPCEEPGVTILTDATGDFTLPVGMQTVFGPALDLEQLSIAEPEELGPGRIMFILKVVNLENVPPDTTWPIQFRAPNGSDFVARMHTDPLGQVFFTLAPGTDTSPLTNPGIPADSASAFTPDGNIRVVIPRSAIGNAAPGEDLTMFLIRVRSPEGAVAPTPDNLPEGLTPTGTYTLRGSENCACPAPDAVDDVASTRENTPVVVSVVANDSDGGAPPLTVISVTPPANGSASNNGDGTVTYRPDSGFVGGDAFDYTIQNGCSAEDTAAVHVAVLRRDVCFEDDAAEIAYTDGWHQLDDAEASAGHLRLHTGRSPEHGMSFTFTVDGETGGLSYYFARSPKGESADVVIDGQFMETLSYQGPNGTINDPELGCAECVRLYPLGQGTHTVELRNVKHRVYVDRFCVTNGGSEGQPQTGPGATSTSTDALAAGLESTHPVSLGEAALSLSVVAESPVAVPLQLVLIDPNGAVLQTALTSGGLAVIESPVSEPGQYVVKTLNLGLGPVQVWTAATPYVQR